MICPNQPLEASKQVELSLILPAHNEEDRLAATLRMYDRALSATYGTSYEIIVVANGSVDRTAQVARGTMRRLPQVRVIEIVLAVGKGGAVLEGFRHARGRRIVFADADGATAPQSLIQLADATDEHDVVIGSRRMAGSRITRKQPLARRLFGRAFVLTARVLFGLPYSDTQCGAKAFRPEAALRLAGAVRERRWTFDLDLLLTCREMGLRVAQHPVEWADQPGSQLRILPTVRDVVPSLWRMVRRRTVQHEPLTERSRAMGPPGDSAYEPTLAHSRV